MRQYALGLSLLDGWLRVPHQLKNCSVSPIWKNPFLPSTNTPKQPFSRYNPKISLAVAIAPVYIIFVLISDSFYAQVMLILILIDVQNSKKAIFSFRKWFSGQNHSSSGSHHLVNLSPPPKNFWSPHPLTLFGKLCTLGFRYLYLRY